MSASSGDSRDLELPGKDKSNIGSAKFLKALGLPGLELVGDFEKYFHCCWSDIFRHQGGYSLNLEISPFRNTFYFNKLYFRNHKRWGGGGGG